MSSQAVQEILSDEQTAESAVREAREQADKARVALEQEYREKLERLPAELEGRRDEAMKRVEAESVKLEGKAGALLQDSIKAARNGDAGNNKQAVEAVITRFQEYVGE